jgi:hypothetical protein
MVIIAQNCSETDSRLNYELNFKASLVLELATPKFF